MAKAINFVGERRKKLTQSQKKDQKLLRISIYAVMVVFAIFLITVGARLFFVFQVKNIVENETQIRNRILDNEPVERDYIIFANKLKKLSVFFGRRKDKQEALEFFSQVFGDEVIVSGIDYSSAKEDVVSFTIKAPNVFIMQRVFEILREDQVVSVYPNIEKSSMRRSATGNYTVDLAVVLVANAQTTSVPLDTLPENTTPESDEL